MFRCCLKRKREFVFEIWLDKVSTRQNRINPPKPTNENFSKSTSDFMACLKVSTLSIVFFLWDSSNFCKLFLCVVLKWIFFFFFLFRSLETTLFRLWSCFSLNFQIDWELILDRYIYIYIYISINLLVNKTPALSGFPISFCWFPISWLLRRFSIS